MVKEILLYQDSIGIGCKIDVTESSNIALSMFFEKEQGKRITWLEGADFFAENFLTPLMKSWDASEAPEKDMAPALQKLLQEFNVPAKDVDDEYVDEFWELMTNISWEIMAADEEGTLDLNQSICRTYQDQNTKRLAELEALQQLPLTPDEMVKVEDPA